MYENLPALDNAYTWVRTEIIIGVILIIFLWINSTLHLGDIICLHKFSSISFVTKSKTENSNINKVKSSIPHPTDVPEKFDYAVIHCYFTEHFLYITNMDATTNANNRIIE